MQATAIEIIALGATLLDCRERRVTDPAPKERQAFGGSFLTIRADVRLIVLAIAVASGCAGCASTRIVNQWRNPDYVSAHFSRILVLGVSKQPATRRTFEDEFVARLRAAGVDAAPSYRYVPEDGPVDQARLQGAVKQAAADAAIMTRLVRVETRTGVTPGFYHPAPGFGLGFYGGYSAIWLGYYEPPQVYQYDVYISETLLYDMASNQLVWGGTAQTTAPGDLRTEVRGYVEIVINALREEGLLPP
jgi:hypothetical protein